MGLWSYSLNVCGECQLYTPDFSEGDLGKHPSLGIPSPSPHQNTHTNPPAGFHCLSLWRSRRVRSMKTRPIGFQGETTARWQKKLGWFCQCGFLSRKALLSQEPQDPALLAFNWRYGFIYSQWSKVTLCLCVCVCEGEVSPYRIFPTTSWEPQLWDWRGKAITQWLYLGPQSAPGQQLLWNSPKWHGLPGTKNLISIFE